MKLCSQCNKPHNEETKTCAVCKSYQAKYREKHREDINCRHRLWDERNREKLHSWYKRYYYSNRKKESERKRKWYKTHKDLAAMRGRRYHNAHPEAANKRRYEYRTRMRDNGGSFTNHEFNKLLAAQEYSCYYCHVPFFNNTIYARYHIDHKTPISRGGSNDIFNIAISCPTCNLVKGKMTDEEYLKWRNNSL
jgi:HNH endonuclease